MNISMKLKAIIILNDDRFQVVILLNLFLKITDCFKGIFSYFTRNAYMSCLSHSLYNHFPTQITLIMLNYRTPIKFEPRCKKHSLGIFQARHEPGYVAIEARKRREISDLEAKEMLPWLLSR